MSIEETGQLIKRTQHRHQRAMDLALAPLGISFVQWNALREISRNPKSPQRRLADLTFNSDQAFGALCTRMEKAGLITKKPGPSRALHLSLTAEGKRLLRAGQSRFSEVLEKSFAGLNAKEHTLLEELLLKLLGPTTSPVPKPE